MTNQQCEEKTNTMKTVKCMVASINANGEPDIYFVKVNCTQIEFDEGKHYDRAKEEAENEGYEPKLVFDEFDRAGKAMSNLFAWNTASIV